MKQRCNACCGSRQDDRPDQDRCAENGLSFLSSLRNPQAALAHSTSRGRIARSAEQCYHEFRRNGYPINTRVVSEFVVQASRLPGAAQRGAGETPAPQSRQNRTPPTHMHCVVEGLGGQGQRQLTPVCRKDFEHELGIPATRAAFHDQAAFSGVLLEQ